MKHLSKKLLCLCLIANIGFIGSSSHSQNLTAADQEAVVMEVEQQFEESLLDKDSQDIFKKVSKDEIPEDAIIIKANSLSEYKEILSNILESTNYRYKTPLNDITKTALKETNSNTVSLLSAKKVVSSERKMYTASNIMANFNLSAIITVYSDDTLKASDYKMTLSGVTAFHKLTDIEYEVKYNSSQKVVKVQANYGITYYVATPWDTYDVITDNKNQYFHYSVAKGIHDYDVVG